MRNVTALGSLLMPICLVIFIATDSVGWLIGVAFGTICMISWTILMANPGTPKGAKNGWLVSGRIVSYRDRGSRSNDRMNIIFTVEFTTVDGRSVQTTTERLVAPMEASQFQPGTVVPIRYDPADPRECIIESADQTNPYHHVSAFDRRLVERQLEAGQISPEMAAAKLAGAQARGVIIGSAPTGTTPDGRISYELLIRVTRPDGSTFDARKQVTVSKARRWGMQVGRVADVFYHPEDEQTIYVDISPFRRRQRVAEVSNARP